MIPALATRLASAEPQPLLPPAPAGNRYRFAVLGRPWRIADDRGLRLAGDDVSYPDTETLTFDAAIDLAHRYREEADLAADRGATASARQWIEWAGELERWAAGHREPPGRVIYGMDRASGPDRTASLYVRRDVRPCDQAPSFSEMTRRHSR